MKKNSTLIYFVNRFNFDTKSDVFDTDIQVEETLTKMDNDKKMPSDRTIKNILDFARSYEVLETEETGYVEMILN